MTPDACGKVIGFFSLYEDSLRRNICIGFSKSTHGSMASHFNLQCDQYRDCLGIGLYTQQRSELGFKPTKSCQAVGAGPLL